MLLVISVDQSNETTQLPVKKGADLVPDAVQYYIDIIITMTLMPMIAAFGIVTNSLNIIVFLKSGVKDCVSICLLSLAISDIGVTSLTFSYSMLQIIVTRGWYFYVDPLSVLVYIAWIIGCFCDVTMLHTSFLSLERCLCVIFPFHFKNLVTPQRAVVVVGAIYVLAVGSIVPILASSGFSEQFDPVYNTTRIMVWYSDDRAYLESLMNIYQNICMNFLSLLMVIICTVGMVSGLRRSSRFTSSTAKSDSVNTRKSRNVIKMVSILSTIYIVCTCARSSAIVPRMAMDGVGPYLQHHNMYQTICAFFFLFGAINSSVNIFVYYMYKPMFKDNLKGLFGCKTQAEDKK